MYDSLNMWDILSVHGGYKQEIVMRRRNHVVVHLSFMRSFPILNTIINLLLPKFKKNVAIILDQNSQKLQFLLLNLILFIYFLHTWECQMR